MRNERPHFSVVVPVSDDLLIEKYGESAVRARGFEKIEHLYVQNSVSEEVKRTTDQFTRNHANHRNIQIEKKGIQVSRNAGIQKAQGEWIVNLDSDVQINRRFFEALEIAIEQNPGVEVLVPRLLRDEGTTLLQRLTSAHFTILSRREKPPINNPGLVVRREVYEQEGLLDTRFKNGNDNDFKRRIKKKQTVFVPDAVVFHTADPGNKLIKQHFKYGRDRSRISRLSHPEDRMNILKDRLETLLFWSKFLKHRQYGLRMATYEATLGVVSATGFWYEELRNLLPNLWQNQERESL